MATDQVEIPATYSIHKAVLHDGETHGFLSKSAYFQTMTLLVIHWDLEQNKLINPDGVFSHP